MADTIVSEPTRVITVDNDKGYGGYRNQGPTWSAEPTFGQTAQAVHVANGDLHLLNAMLSQFGFIRDGQGAIRSDVRDSAAAVTAQVTGLGDELQGELCDIRVEQTKQWGDIRLSDEKNFGQVVRDISTARGELQSLLVSGFKDGRYDAAVNTAAIQLKAAENHASLAAQLAECCCELKEAIGAEGAATRALITQTNMDDLRERLSAANSALLSLKANVII